MSQTSISYGFFGVERECPVDHKLFIIHGDYWPLSRGSGARRIAFCSWHCLRKWDRTHGSKIERRERIIQGIKDGLTNKEISVLLEEDITKVDYWRKKMEKEAKRDEGQGN